MKSSAKKYLIGLSAFSCLIFGIFLGKPILSLIYPQSTTVDSPNAIFMSRDITTYTQDVDAIVIGDVREVSDPYLKSDRGITLQQDAQINIREVLKGNTKMTSLKVGDLAWGITEEFSPEKGVSSLKGKYGLLKPGENVLLFLGTNNWGDYVVFAGPNGKYLIDKDNNVTSIGNFKMSLEDLKAKIKEALKIPAQKYIPPPPISVEN